MELLVHMVEGLEVLGSPPYCIDHPDRSVSCRRYNNLEGIGRGVMGN